MTAEIITIGDEILSGHTVNTNAAFIGERLTAIDVAVVRQTAVGDEPATITAVIREACGRVEVVIATGGLGPTHDDVTRNAVVAAFHRPLVEHPQALAALQGFFAARGRELDEINKSQALLPRGSTPIPNTVGTAPGIHIAEKGRYFYALPGVPAEMRQMMTGHVIPFLRTITKPRSARAILFTTGVPESKLYARLRTLLAQHPAVKVAFLPGYHGVKIHGSATLQSTNISQQAVQAWKTAIQAELGPVVYSETAEPIETVIGELLRKKGRTLALAESCTGGLIAKRITDIPGSSGYFVHGYVTYSNQSKIELLGVDPNTLEHEGAVSDPVARQMAEGAKKQAGADYAVAVTGIAGPGGGTQAKPVGLTFIAIAGGGEILCRKFFFGTERDINRRRAAQAALNLLRERLLGVV